LWTNNNKKLPLSLKSLNRSLNKRGILLSTLTSSNTTTTKQDLHDIAVEECKDELTDYTVYSKLANRGKPAFREAIRKIAGMEMKHYNFWKKYCPDKIDQITVSNLVVNYVLFIRTIFGASFAIKYLEKKERQTIKKYDSLSNLIPPEDREAFEEMIADEKEHERNFAKEVEGSYLKYISFIVLGLADALVEIAGIHAGSLGIYNSTLITGLAGIIAGAAASIAMASAAYAQAKQGFQGSASLSALYTGFSYFINAVILATPYFLTQDKYLAITVSLILGILIIAFISYYNSVLSEQGFARDFLELAGIMLGATAALYLIGYVVRLVLHITIS
jgi:VIT1/CCC1 family predicted Fe2+/Mn2+ transporter